MMDLWLFSESKLRTKFDTIKQNILRFDLNILIFCVLDILIYYNKVKGNLYEK